MGRLSRIPSLLAAMPPALASMPIDAKDAERKRAEFHPWRALYKTKRWMQLRWATLVRDLFTCQMCGKIEADSSKLVADHKRPHRGDEALFFDPENVETLCASPCHAKHKQRLEQAEEYR
jgi:5-methylcytosine-specific restriction protein A